MCIRMGVSLFYVYVGERQELMRGNRVYAAE
jgi:hypothetical protein